MRAPDTELISTTKVLRFQATNQGTHTKDNLETTRTAGLQQVRLTTNLATMLIVHHLRIMVPLHNLARITTLKPLKTIVLWPKRCSLKGPQPQRIRINTLDTRHSLAMQLRKAPLLH
jgi:hypothetical protein